MTQDERREHKRIWRAAYYQTHREDIDRANAPRHAIWCLLHKEELSVRHHDWNQTHRALRAGYSRDWRGTSNYREYRSKYLRTARCRELRCLQWGKRKAEMYLNTPIAELLTEVQWHERLEQYDGRCAYCGEKCDDLTLDHIIPLSKGGKHSIANVVPACPHCNYSKQASTAEQWQQCLKTGNGCRPLELVVAAGPYN